MNPFPSTSLVKSDFLNLLKALNHLLYLLYSYRVSRSDCPVKFQGYFSPCTGSAVPCLNRRLCSFWKRTRDG